MELEAESEAMFGGEIEVDESYFGGKRKGKRVRGAAGKIPVFGLLKRGGKVYTKIIPDASGATLIPIIERKVVPDSIFGSTTPNSSRMPIITSTESRISGTRQSATCANSTVFRRLHSAYI